MINLSKKTIIGLIGVLVLFIAAWWVIYSDVFAVSTMQYESMIETKQEPTIVRGPRVVHQAMPSEVRAIYMTACYGASEKLRNNLVRLIENTELNSIMIDIKDYTGTIAVPTEAKILESGQEGTGCKMRDIKEFIELLHSKGIYVIGRITVFQDPLHASQYPELAVHRLSAKTTPWKDYKGLAFIDVGAKKYWDYIVSLAKESHDILGFDELNFDYIRYPSDGNMADTYFTHSGGNRGDVDMPNELEKFFIYLHSKMSEPNAYGEVPKTSADIFGMTTTNYDDLTIGQVLEKTLPYFDVTAPMVYPSHYPSGFIGIENPNKEVYKIVNYSMSRAVERTKEQSYSTDRLRSWIQDFDYGGDYGIAEVNAQIKASRDAGVTGGYMLWDPANRYTRGVSY